MPKKLTHPRHQPDKSPVRPTVKPADTDAADSFDFSNKSRVKSDSHNANAFTGKKIVSVTSSSSAKIPARPKEPSQKVDFDFGITYLLTSLFNLNSYTPIDSRGFWYATFIA